MSPERSRSPSYSRFRREEDRSGGCGGPLPGEVGFLSGAGLGCVCGGRKVCLELCNNTYKYLKYTNIILTTDFMHTMLKIIENFIFCLGGGAFIYFFSPFWERLSQVTNIFGKALNHQLLAILVAYF